MHLLWHWVLFITAVKCTVPSIRGFTRISLNSKPQSEGGAGASQLGFFEWDLLAEKYDALGLPLPDFCANSSSLKPSPLAVTGWGHSATPCSVQRAQAGGEAAMIGCPRFQLDRTGPTWPTLEESVGLFYLNVFVPDTHILTAPSRITDQSRHSLSRRGENWGRWIHRAFWHLPASSSLTLPGCL